LPPRPDGPPPLRKMILPALFVGGLFYVTFTREPEVPQQLVIQGEALGTTWVVKSAEISSDESKKLLQEVVETALAEVDLQMSTYREDSELMTLNRAAALEGVPVSAELAGVVQEALEIGHQSMGAFDVTLGPAVRAWGFGPDNRRVPPAPGVMESLASVLGQDKVRLSGGMLYKSHPEVEIDLSAIAKGYAVDLVVERLRAAGRQNLMAEVGGEIVARGVNPRGESWRLGIETPTEQGREVHRVVSLQDAAMATSGDYRNYYEVEGRRVSHLIDPRTMRPIEHRLASVTVVAQRCSTADAWATGLSVLGMPEAVEVAERLSLAALFIVRDADGSFTTTTTSAFDALE
jgi:FAD:protein FMN transferase